MSRIDVNWRLLAVVLSLVVHGALAWSLYDRALQAPTHLAKVDPLLTEVRLNFVQPQPEPEPEPEP
ncbi:MAG: hypothetical protein ABW066_01325, partial [Sedimenticola sp.]